jgi:hypothetical protein
MEPSRLFVFLAGVPARAGSLSSMNDLAVRADSICNFSVYPGKVNKDNQGEI